MPFVDFEGALEKRRASSPARGYLWCVDLPDLLQPPADPANSRSFRSANEDARKRLAPVDVNLLNTLVTNATIPLFSINTDKVTDGNTFWYRASHNDIGNISLTLEEQEGGIVWDYIQNWLSLVNHSNGGYNPPSFYKRDIKLFRLDTMKQVFQVFIYRGYFISEAASVGNDYSSNQPLSYNISFTGDSLTLVNTLSKRDFEANLEAASAVLGGVEIPYNQFKFAGVASGVVANALRTVGNRVFQL